MNFKKISKIIALVFLSSFFLVGCVKMDANGQPTGMVYEWLAVPMERILIGLADVFNSYGVSIIVVSIVVRMLMMPLTFSQAKKMLVQQEKMAKLKPYVDAIQERAKLAETQEEKMAIQQEQMELYRLNNVSLAGGMGCLPLLIQIPIFSALYTAIRYSTEIKEASFMGISLGEPYIILAFVTAAIYLVQSYVAQSVMEGQQKEQMKKMMYMTPVMMLMVTMSAPSGVGFYFVAGGVWAVIQTWIQNTFIRPKVKKEIDQELTGKEVVVPKSNGSARPIKQARPVKATQNIKSETFSQKTKKNQGRNAGKQNRK